MRRFSALLEGRPVLGQIMAPVSSADVTAGMEPPLGVLAWGAGLLWFTLTWLESPTLDLQPLALACVLLSSWALLPWLLMPWLGGHSTSAA